MNGLLQRIRRRRPEDPAARPEQPAAPAGTEPEIPDAAATPSFRHRGRLRRRLRYLRRARELGYRDVGGLVFDLRRFGRDEPALVSAKLDALTVVDAELRGLEDALADHRAVIELREPGVGACGRCAALHASDARFCSACGSNLSAAGQAVVVAPGTPAQVDQPQEPATPAEGAADDPQGEQAASVPADPAAAAEQPTVVAPPVTPDRGTP